MTGVGPISDDQPINLALALRARCIVTVTNILLMLFSFPLFQSLSYNRFMHSYLVQPWNEDIRREREAHEVRLAPWRTLQGRCKPTSFPTKAAPSWPSTGMYTPGPIVPKTDRAIAVGVKAKYPFPQSVTAFNSMAQEDKFRVAKFLSASGAPKAKMEAEYGWSNEMVQKLSEAYTKDVSQFSLRYCSSLTAI